MVIPHLAKTAKVNVGQVTYQISPGLFLYDPLLPLSSSTVLSTEPHTSDQYTDPRRGTDTSTPETHLTLGSEVITAPALSQTK